VWHYCSDLCFEVNVEHAKDTKIRALPPIGMEFVKMKEATSSHIVAGRSCCNTPPNSSEARTRISDFDASFSHKQTNLCRRVQADVH
jgi:hypothetical protein